jgi:hypothetical protein
MLCCHRETAMTALLLLLSKTVVVDCTSEELLEDSQLEGLLNSQQGIDQISLNLVRALSKSGTLEPSESAHFASEQALIDLARRLADIVASQIASTAFAGAQKKQLQETFMGSDFSDIQHLTASVGSSAKLVLESVRKVSVCGREATEVESESPDIVGDVLPGGACCMFFGGALACVNMIGTPIANFPVPNPISGGAMLVVAVTERLQVHIMYREVKDYLQFGLERLKEINPQTAPPGEDFRTIISNAMKPLQLAITAYNTWATGKDITVTSRTDILVDYHALRNLHEDLSHFVEAEKVSRKKWKKIKPSVCIKLHEIIGVIEVTILSAPIARCFYYLHHVLTAKKTK